MVFGSDPQHGVGGPTGFLQSQHKILASRVEGPKSPNLRCHSNGPNPSDSSPGTWKVSSPQVWRRKKDPFEKRKTPLNRSQGEGTGCLGNTKFKASKTAGALQPKRQHIPPARRRARAWPEPSSEGVPDSRAQTYVGVVSRPLCWRECRSQSWAHRRRCWRQCWR